MTLGDLRKLDLPDDTPVVVAWTMKDGSRPPGHYNSNLEIETGNTNMDDRGRGMDRPPLDWIMRRTTRVVCLKESGEGRADG